MVKHYTRPHVVATLSMYIATLKQFSIPCSYLGLDNIAILSPLCNIRVYNINIANIFHISIISHMQYIAEYRHISQAILDGLNKYISTIFTDAS